MTHLHIDTNKQQQQNYKYKPYSPQFHFIFIANCEPVFPWSTHIFNFFLSNSLGDIKRQLTADFKHGDFIKMGTPYGTCFSFNPFFPWGG